MNTGDRLREQRKRVGLSLGQVAEYEGVSKSYLSDLERGVNSPPAWPLLARLAKRYRTNSDYLLGNTDNPLPIDNGPLPAAVQEAVELMLDLSPARQAELVQHARVLAEAERAADLREYDRMMGVILALGGDALADEVEAMLRAGDPATALGMVDDIVARWRGRLAQAEADQEQVNER